MTVGFEWDPAKAESNLDRHGVDFADAAVALEDPHALTLRDPYSDEEERFITVCVDPAARTLVLFTRGGSRESGSSRRAKHHRENVASTRGANA